MDAEDSVTEVPVEVEDDQQENTVDEEAVEQTDEGAEEQTEESAVAVRNEDDEATEVVEEEQGESGEVGLDDTMKSVETKEAGDQEQNPPAAVLPIESGDDDMRNIDVEENIDLGISEIEEAEIQLGSDELIISVSDPIKKVDDKKGLFAKGTFVAYKVTTKVTLPQYETSKKENKCMIVRRRFRDFVELSEQLINSYTGYFIPIRPDKEYLGSSNDKEFVEMRKQDLQEWLRKLAQHPVLRVSPILINFLELDEDYDSSLARMVTPKDEDPQLAAIFDKRKRDMKTSVTREFFGQRQAVETKETDESYKNSKRDVNSLEKALAKASTAAEEMVYTFRDMAVALREVGLDFFKLSTFEDKSGDAQHSYHCKVMSRICVKTSKIVELGQVKAIRSLNVLHSYLAYAPAIKAACQDRTSVILVLESIDRDIVKKMDQIKKLEEREKTKSSDPMTAKKREESLQELKLLEKLKAYAAEQVSKTKRIVKEEFVRYDGERKKDFRDMLKNYSMSQSAMHAEMKDFWDMAEKKLRDK